MSADLFLAVIFFIGGVCVLAWLVNRVTGDKRPEPQSYTFTATMKYAELHVVVHYENDPENPFVPSAQRIIGLWAIRREERKETDEFWLALESELRTHFPNYRPQVVSIAFSEIKSEPPPVPPRVPRSEQVKAELTSDADTVQEIGDTMNALRNSRKDLWTNKYPGSERPLGWHLDLKADALIKDVLHGLKRSR